MYTIAWLVRQCCCGNMVWKGFLVYSYLTLSNQLCWTQTYAVWFQIAYLRLNLHSKSIVIGIKRFIELVFCITVYYLIGIVCKEDIQFSHLFTLQNFLKIVFTRFLKNFVFVIICWVQRFPTSVQRLISPVRIIVSHFSFSACVLSSLRGSIIDVSDHLYGLAFGGL